VNYDGPNPYIVKCHKPGQLYQTNQMPWEIALCPECYQSMNEAGKL
jgi:hypothetical protein